MSSTFKLCDTFLSLPPPPPPTPSSLSLSRHPESFTKATFFTNSPHLSLHTFHFLSIHAVTVYTNLYYTPETVSDGKVKKSKKKSKTSPGVLTQDIQGNVLTLLHDATPSHMPSPRSVYALTPTMMKYLLVNVSLVHFST